MSDATIKPLSTVIAAFVAIMAAVLFFYVLQLISVNVNRRIKKSKTDIDDLLLSPKIVKAISLVATSLLIGVLLPGLTYHYPDSIKAVNKICRVLNISAVAYLLILETKAFCEILRLRNAQRSGVLVIRNILETLIHFKPRHRLRGVGVGSDGCRANVGVQRFHSWHDCRHTPKPQRNA